MNFDEQAEALAGLAIHTVMDDHWWKEFGFSKRPKRGRFFDKFINKDQLAIETFLVRELTLVSMIDLVETIKAKHLPDALTGKLTIRVLAEVFVPWHRADFFFRCRRLFGVHQARLPRICK